MGLYLGTAKMRYTIDFFEIHQETEVYRFSKDIEFRDLESCKFWVWEYLQTSNIWKNHNMKIEITPKTKKIIYYYAEQ
jgi:hypothetical protein